MLMQPSLRREAKLPVQIATIRSAGFLQRLITIRERISRCREGMRELLVTSVTRKRVWLETRRSSFISKRLPSVRTATVQMASH